MAKMIVGLIVVALVLAPGFVGWQLSNKMIRGQEAQCRLIEEGLSQINPDEEGPDAPKTAEECLKMVAATKPMTRAVFVVGSYVAAIVFGGFSFTFWLLIGRHIWSAFRSEE